MTNLLEIDGIMFSTGVRQRSVEASGYLQEGGVLNICGPSGSGKTTLLRVLARLKEVQKGKVMFRGESWRDFPPAEWRRLIHYLAQNPVIFDGTVLHNLARPYELAALKKVGLRFNRERAVELMEEVLLGPELLEQDARTLSGGEASRLALVRAMLAEPQVILMDEPLAALDQNTASAVLALVDQWLKDREGRGIVLVSHNGNFAEMPRLSMINLETQGGNPGE